MSTNDDGKASFFARYIHNPPEKRTARTRNNRDGRRHQKAPALAQKSLDQTDRHNTRYLHLRTQPHPGDKKTTLRIAETLAEQGWLVPLESYRYDRREWEIVRRPTPRSQP